MGFLPCLHRYGLIIFSLEELIQAGFYGLLRHIHIAADRKTILRIRLQPLDHEFCPAAGEFMILHFQYVAMFKEDVVSGLTQVSRILYGDPDAGPADLYIPDLHLRRQDREVEYLLPCCFRILFCGSHHQLSGAAADIIFKCTGEIHTLRERCRNLAGHHVFGEDGGTGIGVFFLFKLHRGGNDLLHMDRKYRKAEAFHRYDQPGFSGSQRFDRGL